ncbi:hypothetical protein [Mycobacterium sp. C31M]
MARLPRPGGDSGTWGDVLNDYLAQSHKADGTLKDNSVTANVIAPNSVTNAAIADNAVNAASVADGSITEALLDGGVQAKLNQAAPTWSTISGKPAVVASGMNSADARATISAKADSWLPESGDISDAGVAGKAIVQASTAAQARQVLDVPAVHPDGHYTPTGKANGAIGAMDTGQAVSSFGNSAGLVDGGVIVHTPTNPSGASAAYYQVNAGGRVRRIGCEVRWAPNSVGALAIVLPVSAWSSPGGNLVAGVAGMHLVIYGNGVWHCSEIFNPANLPSVERKYAQYTTHGRPATVWDGEWRKIELWIDPDNGEATLFHPDGSFVRFRDDAIANSTGTFAIWEQFENNVADVPCEIRNLWYDTGEVRRDGPIANRAQVAEILDASTSSGWPLLTTPTSGGTKTLTSQDVPTQVFTGSASHTAVLPGPDTAAGAIFWIHNSSNGIITVNGPDNVFNQALASGRTGLFVAMVANPTLASQWRALVFATLGGAEALTSKTISSSRWVATVSTTTTAAGSTTMTLTSSEVQVFTGSTTHTCILPTTNIVAGVRHIIINNSTGTVTVNASGGATVIALAAGDRATVVALQTTPTTNAHWALV